MVGTTGPTTGTITGIIITNAGNGYTTTPNVTIAPPAIGTPATAVATVNGISAGLGDTSQFLTVKATTNNTALISIPSDTYTSPQTSGAITYSILPNVSGTATITVTVTDNGNTTNGGVNTTSQSFTVTVNPVNQQPTINPINNVQVVENSGPQTVTFGGVTTGPGNIGQSLTVTATSSNPALHPQSRRRGDGLGDAQRQHGGRDHAQRLGHIDRRHQRRLGLLERHPPVVTISQPTNGTTAQASATVNSNGVITGLTIINPGSGYSDGNPPTITIAAPTGVNGVQATASPIVTSGSDYVLPPVVTLSGDGSGGLASAILGSGPTAGEVTGITLSGVYSITVTNGGSGYSSVSPPVVTFSGGGATTNATAVAVVNSSGVVSAITSRTPGQATPRRRRSRSPPPVVPAPRGRWPRRRSTPPVRAIPRRDRRDRPAAGQRDCHGVHQRRHGGRDHGHRWRLRLSEAPVVTLSGGGFLTPASATAVVNNGQVVAIKITGGSGYNTSANGHDRSPQHRATVGQLYQPQPDRQSLVHTGSLASGTATITVVVTNSGPERPHPVGLDQHQLDQRNLHCHRHADHAPPTLNVLPGPVTILENAGPQTVDISGITSGADASQVLTVTAASNNAGLIPNPSVTYNNPDTTGYITYTPLPNVSGTAVITVTVTDNGGTASGGSNTTSQTFTVVVVPVNQPPTLNPILNPPALCLIPRNNRRSLCPASARSG